MDISIGKLNITSFCLENLEHIKFRNELKEDDLIYEFVSTSIESDIELENSYIIRTKDELVGYIYLKLISEEDNIVELRYSVHPKYRGLGYGKRILEECRQFLFNVDMNCVELHIRKDNENSIRCAESAEYELTGENNDEYFYIYKSLKKVNKYED